VNSQKLGDVASGENNSLLTIHVFGIFLATVKPCGFIWAIWASSLIAKSSDGGLRSQIVATGKDIPEPGIFESPQHKSERPPQ